MLIRIEASDYIKGLQGIGNVPLRTWLFQMSQLDERCLPITLGQQMAREDL